MHRIVEWSWISGLVALAVGMLTPADGVAGVVVNQGNVAQQQARIEVGRAMVAAGYEITANDVQIGAAEDVPWSGAGGLDPKEGKVARFSWTVKHALVRASGTVDAHFDSKTNTVDVDQNDVELGTVELTERGKTESRARRQRDGAFPAAEALALSTAKQYWTGDSYKSIRAVGPPKFIAHDVLQVAVEATPTGWLAAMLGRHRAVVDVHLAELGTEQMELKVVHNNTYRVGPVARWRETFPPRGADRKPRHR